MRWPPGVVVIEPRVGPRLDRHEAVRAVFIRQRAASAGEVGIERRRVLVVLMAVASGRVCLPDFNQSLRHGAAIVVEHAAAYDDALANRIARMLPGKVAVSFAGVFVAV